VVDEWVEVALALGDRELHVMDHPLAAHSVMRALPLAPTTVPKSPDRRLRRSSPGPSVLTLATKFPL